MLAIFINKEFSQADTLLCLCCRRCSFLFPTTIEALVHLQEQQQAISAGLAGFVQPEHQDGLEEQHAGAGNDEYDPEDADMQLGF